MEALSTDYLKEVSIGNLIFKFYCDEKSQSLLDKKHKEVYARIYVDVFSSENLDERLAQRYLDADFVKEDDVRRGALSLISKHTETARLQRLVHWLGL